MDILKKAQIDRLISCTPRQNYFCYYKSVIRNYTKVEHIDICIRVSQRAIIR